MLVMPLAIKWLSNYDIFKLEHGVVFYFAISCAFAWGSYFTLARKMLQIMESNLTLLDPVERLYYESTEFHINFLKGIAWERGAQDFGYDENLIEKNLEWGKSGGLP